MNVARASMNMGMQPGGGNSSAASDPAGSSIFKSIQAFGIKLEPRKLPLDLLVMDRIEKTPTAN